MLTAVPLTARQQQVLEIVRNSIVRRGCPPTRAEIADELGFKSSNAAEEHLQALARKGIVQMSRGTARNIKIIGEALPVPAQAPSGMLALPVVDMWKVGLTWAAERAMGVRG